MEEGELVTWHTYAVFYQGGINVGVYDPPVLRIIPTR